MIYVLGTSDAPRKRDTVKIGSSNNVDRRIKELQRNASLAFGVACVPLVCLATCEGGVSEEKLLQRALFMYRAKGNEEWFKFGPLVASTVEWMRQGLEFPEIIRLVKGNSRYAERMVLKAQALKTKRLQRALDAEAKAEADWRDAAVKIDAYYESIGLKPRAEVGE